MTINSGPDQGQTYIDHEARVKTIEMEYLTTGELAPDTIQYLISTAKQAIELEKAHAAMAAAGIAFVEASDKVIAELEHKLLVANFQVSILKIALGVEDDK